jgi:hypothetical protein
LIIWRFAKTSATVNINLHPNDGKFDPVDIHVNTAPSPYYKPSPPQPHHTFPPQLHTPPPRHTSPAQRHTISNFSPPSTAQHDFQIYPKREQSFPHYFPHDKNIQHGNNAAIPDINYSHIKHISGEFHESFYPTPHHVYHPQLSETRQVINRHIQTRALTRVPNSPSVVNTQHNSHMHTVSATAEELQGIIKQRSFHEPLQRKGQSTNRVAHVTKRMHLNNTSTRPYSEFHHLNLTTTKTLPWYQSLRR